jgi:hypothetical protein
MGTEKRQKFAKIRSCTIPFLTKSLVAFPHKNTAKFSVQNGVVGARNARKVARKIYPEERRLDFLL